MSNLARMANGWKAAIKRCLNNSSVCRRCGNKSCAAVETWDGYKPACLTCAQQAEKLGYKVVYPKVELKND